MSHLDARGDGLLKFTRKRLTIAASAAVLAVIVAVAVVAYGVQALLPPSTAQESARARLTDIATTSWQIIGFAFAVGLATMSALEVIKRLTSVRGYYHLYQLQQVLSPDAILELYERIAPRSTPRPDGRLAANSPSVFPIWPRLQRRELSADWFDIPLEQLVGQLSGLAEEQLTELYGSDGPPPPLNAYLLTSLTNTQSSAPREPLTPNQVDTLRAQLELALDRMQLLIGTRWRRTVRLGACFTAAVLATGVTVTTGTSPYVTIGLALTAFVVGGFFAWVARDLVAVVERGRRS